MRICIFGAGAIGAYLGGVLTEAGADVTLIARGAHLDAMRANGLALERDGRRSTVAVRCTDDSAALGPQDYVVVTLKAHSLAPAVDRVVPLLGPETAIVTAQNGILWWYFYGLPGPWANRRLESTDPGGVLWHALGPERAIGCVVYPSCEIVAPGVVRHLHGNRFMLGEPDGSRSARVTALSEVMTAAGLKGPVRPRIRDDIWFKLLGNTTFNPVSVLTGGTLADICADPRGRALIRRMMLEARDVGDRLGVRFAMDVDKRIDAAAAVGAHKTSMLQDFERGRPLELDALVASVCELGELVGSPTPTIDAVLALVRLKLETSRPAG